MDEFDKAILVGVQAGAFDSNLLTPTAKTLAAQIAFQKLDNSFSEAWDSFHGSLNIPADEVLDKMAKAFRAAVKTITPINLSGTISLFKELGQPERAKELLEFYMQSRSDEKLELFDLKKSAFGSDVKDPDVRAAFLAKTSSLRPQEVPGSILRKIAKKEGWNEDELAQLATLSPGEFKEIFKASDGTELRAMIKTALEFGNIVNGSNEMKTIAENATSALRAIAAESTINARRLGLYGISPDTLPPA
jgi:hypothetical protein